MSDTATRLLLCLAVSLTAPSCASDPSADASSAGDGGDAPADVSGETPLPADARGDTALDRNDADATAGPACGSEPLLGTEEEVVAAPPGDVLNDLAADQGSVLVAGADLEGGVQGRSKLGWLEQGTPTIRWVSSPIYDVRALNLYAGKAAASGMDPFDLHRPFWVAAWGALGEAFVLSDPATLVSCLVFDGTACYGNPGTVPTRELMGYTLVRTPFMDAEPAEVLYTHDRGAQVFDAAALVGTALYTLERNWLDGLAIDQELWVTDLPSGTRRLVEAAAMRQCWEWDCKLFAGPRGVVWADASKLGPVRWRLGDQPGQLTVDVAPGANGPIVADDSHVYWSDGERVWRRELCLPLAAPELVVDAPVRAIAVDDRAVYWIDELGARLWRRSKIGAPP